MTAEELVDRLERVKRASGGWTARCPAHEDKNPSLSITEGDDGRILLHCHAGCTIDQITAAMQLEPTDLFPPHDPDTNGSRRIVDTYPYVDASGSLLYEVVRFDPKDFRQRQPDGNGGWQWNLKGVEPVLYRLDKLTWRGPNGNTEPLYIVEGEKDVHAAEKAGVLATCNPMGAGKWRPSYTDTIQKLRLERVIVVADRDKTGRDHARDVAGQLDAAGVTVELLEPTHGKDVAAHLAAGHTLDELAAPTDEPPEEATDELDAPDHSWTPIDLAALGANPPAPPTIGGLVYPGRRHLFLGEPESLKTWGALCICATELQAGHTVIYLDFENGGGSILERLRALGLTATQIRDQFLYLEPDEPIGNHPQILHDIHHLLETRTPTVAVVDSYEGAASLHELDPDKGKDVETFYRTIINTFTRHNCATIVIDHVVKRAEERGKFAIGSQRKIGVVDCALIFTVTQPFGRGRTGKAKINVSRDRPGHLPRPNAAELTLTSNPDTTITYTLTIAEHTTEKPAFRPTGIMENVSRYLELRNEPVSINTVTQDVTGKSDTLRIAIVTLIQEGYVTETSGARNARLLSSHTPYREADEPHLAPSSRPHPHLSPEEDDLTSPLSPHPFKGERSKSRDQTTTETDDLAPTELDLGTATIDDLHAAYPPGRVIR